MVSKASYTFGYVPHASGSNFATRKFKTRYVPKRSLSFILGKLHFCRCGIPSTLLKSFKTMNHLNFHANVRNTNLKWVQMFGDNSVIIFGNLSLLEQSTWQKFFARYLHTIERKRVSALRHH